MNLNRATQIISWIGVPIALVLFIWMARSGYRGDVSLLSSSSILLVPFGIAIGLLDRHNKLMWGVWAICVSGVLVGAYSLGRPAVPSA